MRFKFKNLLNIIIEKQMIFWILIIIGVIYGSIYFSSTYLNNGKLTFTSEDKFILLLFLGSILLTSCMFIFLIFRTNDLKKSIEQIKEIILSNHDNSIKLQRLTQLLILKGDDGHE